MRIVTLALLFCFLISISVNAVPSINQWSKGDIHYHTTNSDGSATLDTMITSYRDSGGHKFSACTDHDYISDASGYTTGSFIGVNSVEASGGPHVVGFGISGTGSYTPGTTLQQEIDNIISAGGLPMVAHVYWSEDYSSYDMDTLLANMTDCNIISVFNWYCEDVWGNGNSEAYWDTMLTAGKIVYGYAEDDAHGTGRTGYTFNMVGVDSLSQANIKAALQNGTFYFGYTPTKWGAGITISTYTVTGIDAGDTISVSTNGATTIRFIGENGGILQTTNSSSATYTITGDEPYVRVKATNTNGDITWLQPVFVGGEGGGSTGGEADYLSVDGWDGWTKESTETSGVGGSYSTTATYIGDTSKKQQYIGILHFDTSAIPDDRTVTSASITMRRLGAYGTPTTLGNLTVDIKNGYFGTTDTLRAEDFQAAASATNVATMSYPASNGAYSTGNLNASGCSNINKAGVTQLKIRFTTDDDNDSTGDYLNIYDSASWPTLHVVWE